MPLQATSGAASYDAFGGGVAAVPNYIEDVFQTWLYTGNGSTQTINNGIDLAGKGGLVWLKQRGNAAAHYLFDTARGNDFTLNTNNTSAQGSGWSAEFTSFNSTGFSLASPFGTLNGNGNTYASWTFREQPKFFDVVTWTGPSSAVSHSLGSVPGFVIIKSTSRAGNWICIARRSDGNYALFTDNAGLNLTSAANQPNNANVLSSGALTATTFDPSWFNSNGTPGDVNNINQSGVQYVAYLFAHNAGGFGLTGTDNVISCGSFTTDGSGNATVNLGYEPQWVLVKNTQTSGTSWVMLDNMRGWTMGNDSALLANLSNAENTGDNYGNPTATGFYINNNGGTWAASNTHIYIAIRRGPMRTPTTGTSVYTSSSRTGTAGVIPRWTAGFPVDWALRKSDVTTGGGDWQAGDRLRGAVQLKPNLTEAETSASPLYTFDSMTGYSSLGATGSDTSDRSWMFRRAPGFFDEVCYTGVYNGGAPRNITHNLGVAPELIIVKCRSTASTNWVSCTKNGSANSVMLVNSTAASSTVNGPGYPSVVDSTSTTFQVREWANMDDVNATGRTYVAYLFASCPGVSKVFNYTGNGSSQTINCGFTGGARFVMIKRTDSTGDWYVWDSARGIVSGNDPRLSLNSTAAEVTTDDSVDTDSTGFVVNQLSATNINVSSATYIGIAIA